MQSSRSRAADDTLKNIQAKFRIRNSGNAFAYGTETYFWEIGRENTDGRITGTVHRDLKDQPNMCRRVGTFCIHPTGVVVRFPGIPRKEWLACQNMTEAERHHLDTGAL